MLANVYKALLLLALALSITGCKLAVIVVEGGEVLSVSGTRDCSVNSICVFEVTDTDFHDTFTAVPQPGWEFVRWNAGGDFFCEDSTDPSCFLSNVGTDGIQAIVDAIATQKTYYIMPVFQPLGAAITDTVVAAGKEWAQPDLFTNLTWGAIDAVCPAGVCGGTLNGFLMDGWTWATVEDFNSLANYYIGSAQMGPGPDAHIGSASMLDGFYADGWRNTFELAPEDTGISGRLRDPADPGAHFGGGAADNSFPLEPGVPNDFFISGIPYDDTPADSLLGAWFYRIP